jgi:MraZ protein
VSKINAILLGEHELTIDEKNRLIIPSEIRRSLSSSEDTDYLYLFVGAANKKPWLYPRNRFEELAGSIESDFAPDPDVLAYRLAFFSNTTRLDWDKQGRVLIPEKILRKTGTGREITMVGVGDHLEMWNRSEWDSQSDQNLASMNEHLSKMKKNRQEQQQQQAQSQGTRPTT